MSRKRKPVLQLGAASSKLHKYGYSKEFHTPDKKGKSSLPALIGNYSDSDDDDSQNEQEEQPTTVAAPEPLPALVDTPATQPTKLANGDGVTGDHDKSPDMDDELKNFLSEIEAIPMPTDGAGAPDQKLDTTDQKYPGSLSKEKPSESVVNDGSKLLEDSAGQQDGDSSSTKSKPQYSMFVKGASEFVHSPSSQDTETTSKAKGEDRLEEDIPEEPTSCWQLVQDEGSQYYYYWNTLTNEVTWEIPSEYTQYLLLHREFTEKLARLPANVLKAYQDRKAKEAELLASASTTQPSVGISADAQSQQAAVYGPVDHSSSAPISTELTSSSTQRASKKHRKEKKKKRHKRRHSDSSSNSSDEGGGKEGSKTTHTYGPELPQDKQATVSGAVPAATKTTSGPQLLSIVPYASDEDAESENEDDAVTNNEPVPETKKTISNSQIINSSGAASAINYNSDTGDDDEDKTKEGKNLHKDVSDQKEFEEATKQNALSTAATQEKVEESLRPDMEDISTEPSTVKVVKLPQEVIDMFAEDTPTNQSSVEDNNKSGKDNEMGQEKQATQLSQSTTKDFASTFSKTTITSSNSTVSFSTILKDSSEDKRVKGKEKKDSGNLLNIVGYGSDEEEHTAGEDNHEKKGQQSDAKVIEETTKRSSSPSDLKKRKKDKKKHRRDDKDRKEKHEDKGLSPPNILADNLGKDIKARVEETLDREISDIVIQTVSQASLSELAGKVSPNIGQTSLPDQGSDQDRETKAKEEKSFKLSKSDREVGKSHKAKEKVELVVEGDKKTKVLKQTKEEKMTKSEEDKNMIQKSELIQQEKAVIRENDKKDDAEDDDDDDIDFEDLDDLDRALEVALEKKKVELAKYEEQERKQEKHLGELMKSEDQPVEKIDQLSDVKAESASELEEKLKTEVKDAAELALSKLEFLDISTDNLSRLQILFIELQTRLHDWVAGGLSTIYFQEQLGVAQGLLEQYEQSAVPPGWACQWDRGNNRYYYRNLTTNRIQWDYPDNDPQKTTTEKPGSSTGNSSKSVTSTGKNRKEDVEKKKSSSSSKREKSHDRGEVGGGGSGEDRDALRKKGVGSSSRHRKREERDKDRGSKFEKRREGSSGSHRYRRKRRRRRDHSSSSDSSDDNEDGVDSANVATGKSSSVISTTSRRGHRHHHKASKKKKKRRSEQRSKSRSPSVEIVAASDDKLGGSKDVVEDENWASSVTVVEASPVNSSSVSTPYLDRDPEGGSAKPGQQSDGVIDEEPLGKSVGRRGNLDGVSMDLEEGKPEEEGEIREEEEEEGMKEVAGEEEVSEKKAEDEAPNPAVIYKPPQLVVPPEVVAAARQPELYGAVQTPLTLTLPAPPEGSIGSGSVPAAGVQGVGEDKGLADGTAEEADKQARKKKKEKKLATGPSLMMKKKHMSSMVQKWQKVKKEVEKEDRAKEMRQAAIRKKIEELK